MSNTQENIADTGQRHPRRSRTGPAEDGQLDYGQTTTRPSSEPTDRATVSSRRHEERPAYRWTDEDIEAARQQEKDKLYPRIEEMRLPTQGPA